MDPDTITRAAAGDRAALDQLFERNLGPLVAFIRMQAGGVVAERESAMDLAQSVCREVLQDFDQFEARGEAAFRNWLLLQATRKIRNRHKHHHRLCRDVAREVGPRPGDEARTLLASYATFSTPSQKIVAAEEVARIEAAILELPEEQREALMMSRIMGLEYEEIAAELGRTASAVRGLVSRGLATLSGKLED